MLVLGHQAHSHDARHIFRQVDRAHRKFSPRQIEYLANIVRLYRGETPEFVAGEDDEHPGPDPDLKETLTSSSATARASARTPARRC
jgi:hypothetical protein